ncbi:MAG: HisA/HisF-related TIM barrel protein [Candidatus Helarchaeota archaeon]
MRIIPVLDILTFEGKKKVVRGIKGERKKYLPINTSKILNDSDPTKMALRFRELGFNEIYIADLDAIQSINRNLDYINEISNETNLKIMLDAGISNSQDTNEIKDLKVSKVIIGTETLTSMEELMIMIKIIGKNKTILSIDMLNGELMTRNLSLKSLHLEDFLKLVSYTDIEEVIFLELTQVGAKGGVNTSLIKKMKKYLSCKLITGGGIKTINDLSEISNLGIDGTLVATSLHEGTLTIDEVSIFLK